MREKQKGEKTHLPADTYEEWVKSQRISHTRKRNGSGFQTDTFEDWIVKRVQTKLQKDVRSTRKGKAAE
ncbi:MAG: hypothetical protein OK422_06490 [Thaumarchaeota archaeon]|nr:hypothetical protein [Nitrososphaerota archaeon]